jgi:uncharacterized coiled-coil DUF342 family protein
MPRKNTDEVIADLEQKLEEAKARAAASRDTRIAKLDEQITAAEAQVTKAQEKVTKLTAERDALKSEATVMSGEPVQDELPAEETEPEAEPVTTGKAKSGRVNA